MSNIAVGSLVVLNDRAINKHTKKYVGEIFEVVWKGVDFKGSTYYQVKASSGVVVFRDHQIEEYFSPINVGNTVQIKGDKSCQFYSIDEKFTKNGQDYTLIYRKGSFNVKDLILAVPSKNVKFKKGDQVLFKNDLRNYIYDVIFSNPESTCIRDEEGVSHKVRTEDLEVSLSAETVAKLDDAINKKGLNPEFALGDGVYFKDSFSRQKYIVVSKDWSKTKDGSPVYNIVKTNDVGSWFHICKDRLGNVPYSELDLWSNLKHNKSTEDFIYIKDDGTKRRYEGIPSHIVLTIESLLDNYKENLK